MPNQNYARRTALIIIFAIVPFISVAAQTAKFPEPREQKLLNGLKLLTWVDPAAQKIAIKIRIHSGAAFDPKDKMGVMALLADILFPTDQTKAFFSEDLDGSFDVKTNYDYIEISVSGKTDELLTMIETLANTITNPQITNENFTKVRDARLRRVLELEKNPAYVADLAAAKRLFVEFPYGRSIEGTPASLMKIDRADLLFARERFLTSDNATIAINGNVKPDFTYRAVRQLFGAWTKADKSIPSSFRLPDQPNPQKLSIEFPNAAAEYSRIALRTAARNDKDFWPDQIVGRILRNLFCLTDESANGSFTAQSHILRGSFAITKNVPVGGGTPLSTCAPLPDKVGEPLPVSIFSPGDFETAKSDLRNELQQKLQTFEGLAGLWLDLDTFRLTSVQNEIGSLQNVTIADAKNAAEKLKNEVVVRVAVTKPQKSETKN